MSSSTTGRWPKSYLCGWKPVEPPILRSVRQSRDAFNLRSYGTRMDLELLQRNWTLVAALIILVPVLIGVLVAMLGQSRGGQLKAKVRLVQDARKRRSACLREVEALGNKLKALSERADRTPPARIDKVKTMLREATLLAETANDHRLIAENTLRQFIRDEFSPERQESLQRRYLLLEPGN